MTPLEHSGYTRPVDHKRLGFIVSGVERFSRKSGKPAGDLMILEVGCGEGDICVPLASLGASVRAFDVDPEAVEEVKRRAAARGLANIEVSVEDGMSFNDGRQYDVAIASEVFEHVLRPEQLASRLADLTHAGSYLIVTTPNGFGPWEMHNRLDLRMRTRRWNWLRRRLGKEPYVWGAGPDHCQFYTRKRIEGILGDAGFRVLEFGKADAVLAALGKLYKRSERLGRIDARLGDRVPYWLASGWYLLLEADGRPSAS